MAWKRIMDTDHCKITGLMGVTLTLASGGQDFPYWFSNYMLGAGEKVSLRLAPLTLRCFSLPGIEITVLSIKWQEPPSFLSLLLKGPSQFQLQNCFLNKLLLWGMKALAGTSTCCLLGMPQLNRAERLADFRAKCRKQLVPNLLSKGAKQSRADDCPGRWKPEPGTCQVLRCSLPCAPLPSAPALRMAVHTTTFSLHGKPAVSIPLNSFCSKYFDPP